MDLIFLCILWIGFQILSVALKSKKRKTNMPQRNMPVARRPQPKTLQELFEQLAGNPQPEHPRPLVIREKAPMRQRQSDDMDVPDMESEPMEAEPLVAESMGEEDKEEAASLEEKSLKEPTVVNSWEGKLSKRNIRAGFIMAQVLDKPRALNPYR